MPANHRRDPRLDDGALAALAAQLAGADEGMAGIASEVLEPLRVVVLGHRAALINEGVSAELADEMAADAHRYVTTLLLGGEAVMPDRRPRGDEGGR